MREKTIASAAMILLSIALASCAMTPGGIGFTATNAETLNLYEDRDEFIESQPSAQPMEIDGIEAFIDEMNESLAKSLKLADYDVEKTEYEGVYEVFGEDYTLKIQTDERGNVVFASCQSSDGTTRKTVSEALIDTLWPMDIVPPEFREKLAIKQMENWVGSDALFEELRRFNGEDQPEDEDATQHPEDESDFSTVIEVELDEPELYVELSPDEMGKPRGYSGGDLKEPTVSKPINPNITADKLPDIGNFGKIPDRDLP